MAEPGEGIEKFDPSQLMDGIRDRIKATFVSLIPDAQWEVMCQGVIDEFFNKKKELNASYNKVEYRTNFEMLVMQMLNEEAKLRFGEHLRGPEFKETWDTNGVPIASAAVQKLIVENSGAMLSSMFGGMINSYIGQFANQMGFRQR